MGAKSELKKQYIIETARQVFMDKGFKDVTMKDIVEACKISRGGLYLYYSSVEEVFLDVLKAADDENDNAIGQAVRKHASSAEILGLFLEEQKKELLSTEGSLSTAVYEYAFLHKGTETLRARFLDAVGVIELLIRTGSRQGDFDCPDPHRAALNAMYIIEGLKISAAAQGIAARDVEYEFDVILDSIGYIGARDYQQHS